MRHGIGVKLRVLIQLPEINTNSNSTILCGITIGTDHSLSDGFVTPASFIS